MDITLVDSEGKEIIKGSYEYLEGEKDLNKKPIIYALIEQEGKEYKLFLKPESDKELQDFIKDLEQVMRH